MAIVSNLVQETSVTTGTGDLTTVAVNGRRTFNTAFGNGATTNVFYYFVSHQSAAEWEVGTGHMSAATTMVRDTVISSSNADAAVNFSAGTKDVVNDIPGVNQMMLLNTGTASITVSHADNGKIVELTGSTARTFTFTASANLGNGWWCITKNNSTEELTLGGNGTELDGLANYISYPGEVRLIQCTGSVLNSTVLKGFDTGSRVTTWTFTKPPGYTEFEVRLGAGGGSGGAGSAAIASTGGGGGAAHWAVLLASTVAATETVTIGAGGVAVAVTSDGNVGGTTTFGSLLSSFGGGGGGSGNNKGAGGGGAVSAGANGGNGATNGVGGEPAGGASPAADTVGASSYAGGGAGGGVGTTQGNAGGKSYFGGGGAGSPSTGATAANGAGGTSVFGGGGGGAAAEDTAPGPGAGGVSTYGGSGGAGAFDAATATTGTAGANGCGGGGGGGAETGTSGAGGKGSSRILGYC